MPDTARIDAAAREDGQGVAATYVAVAESVGVARRAVARWLHAGAVDLAVIDDVVLAVSEACTNAVVHGYRDRPAGTFRLAGDLSGRDLRIVVSDDGCGPAPRVDSPGLGAGLPLMATLAKSLEVRRAAVGHGTVVTMAFDAHARAPAEGRRRRPGDQRDKDVRARRQASAVRAEAAWLGALGNSARRRPGNPRGHLRSPTQRGDRLVGPQPSGR